MGDFAAGFGLIKCIKTMLPGMGMLLLIGLVHLLNRKRKNWLNLYSFLFLFPMCLMGYSKLFFTGEWFRLSNWLYGNIRPVYGYLYFSIAGLLLLRFLVRNLRMNRRVKNLPRWEAKDLQKEITERLTEDYSLGRRYVAGITIYQTRQDISPFSGGIFHPYVVLPERMIHEWDEREVRTILYHEMIHIRYGHIPILFFFSLLKIYWWVNPFIYLAEKQLKEDMELFCDEKCLYYTDTSKETYGTLLLKMIYLLQNTPNENVAAFFRKESFDTMKKRILHLNMFERKGQKYPKQTFAAMLILFFILTGSVFVTSYPRYTVDDTLSLHDERGEMLIYDTEELKSAIEIVNHKVEIHQQALEKLLEEEKIEKEFVYISFETIQKTPGAGGCGNIAMINLEKDFEVEYFTAEDWRTKAEKFFLKYLI